MKGRDHLEKRGVDEMQTSTKMDIKKTGCTKG